MRLKILETDPARLDVINRELDALNPPPIPMIERDYADVVTSSDKSLLVKVLAASVAVVGPVSANCITPFVVPQ
jgi:hypothetical protein